MAVRKVKRRGPTPAAAAQPERRGSAHPELAGFWETRLHPFLERHARLLAVCLVVIASVRIVSTYDQLSLTFDEPGHFACGLQYLARHVYRYESQHPPLARAAIALGPYLAGVRPIGGPEQNHEGVNIIKATGQVDRMAFLMRIGILPFFWIACVVVYLWARRYFSAVIAVLATAFFTLIPTVLAHAGLATTDMPLTACLMAAFLALLVWAESPTWINAVILGMTTALAAVSKFTTLGYLPAAAVLALIFWLSVKRPTRRALLALARDRWPTFGLAILIGALAIWALYWFSFGKVPAWNVTLPAPEFFDGISVALAHNRSGHSAFLLGETSAFGWWYYFPVALAVKTPLALLLLSALGGCLVWLKRSTPGYLPVVAFLLGVLVPAMGGHVNIGVRHVLPVYAGFSILAALGFARLASWAGTPGVTLLFAGVPLIWLILSGARIHPDYLAYFNELADKEPENILVDSDLDWGQEIKRLQRRLRQVHADHVAIKFNEKIIHENLYDLPHPSEIDDGHPAEGWSAVSPTASKHSSVPTIMRGIDAKSIAEAQTAVKPWFERLTPTERVGALLVYYFPPGSPLLKE